MERVHNGMKRALNQMKRAHNQMKRAHNRMKRTHKQMKGAHKDDCGTNFFARKSLTALHSVPLYRRCSVVQRVFRIPIYPEYGTPVINTKY